MLRYGMVGEIDDFARVVAWDFDRVWVDLPVIEEEIRSFVPEFVFVGASSAPHEGARGQVFFRFGDSGSNHTLDVKKDLLVYFFNTKQLRKYPVMEMYLLFKRAF
jgi:hypothetical protein